MSAPRPAPYKRSPANYHAAVERLAESYERVDAQRTEAEQWYNRQVEAAARAEREAEAAVAAAKEAVDTAGQLVERIDAEADEVWRTTVRRLGAFGGPPLPDPKSTDEEYSPHELISAASDFLDKTWRPSQVPRGVLWQMTGLSALGAALAFGLRELALWAGRSSGGDLGVGLPVLALVVLLLAPFVGLWPARVLADRRHATLDLTTIATVVAVGLATTVALYLLF